jgi:arylsulfatase A-like enzyme
MYEESFSTPFVIRYPGHISPGTQVNAMVINTDYAPTLLSYAGISAPAEMQGMNFRPFLENGNANVPWRDALYYHYYEYPLSHKVAKHFGIRTERYKLIHFYDPVKSWELYDLKNDKTEMNNLYDDPRYKKILNKMKKQLERVAQQYKDDEALRLMSN